MDLLSYKIDVQFFPFEKGKKTIVNTINPHSYCTANDDVLFSDSLHSSNLLYPDGIGIVFASFILNGKLIKKISGYDIHQFYLKEASKHSLRVFYLGSSVETLQKIHEKVCKEYPNVSIGMHSPPFKKEFGFDDNKLIIQIINDFSPDILFVGMTAPKQEKWVYLNKAALNVDVICSIGAVFDFFAGTIKRPSKTWQILGLEWLPRLINEPKRLWYRNFVSTPRFIIIVLTLFLKKIFFSNSK